MKEFLRLQSTTNRIIAACIAIIFTAMFVVAYQCSAKPPAKETAQGSPPSRDAQQGQPSAKVFTLEDYQRDLAILQIKLDGVKAAKEAVAQQEVNLSVLIEQYRAKVNEMAQAKAAKQAPKTDAPTPPSQEGK